MTIIDRTQFQRQAAIVDMLRNFPDTIAWHAISELSIEAQEDLYQFLRDIEADCCETCGSPLEENDIDLCGVCADRSEQLVRLQEMCNTSGVVLGERV